MQLTRDWPGSWRLVCDALSHRVRRRTRVVCSGCRVSPRLGYSLVRDLIRCGKQCVILSRIARQHASMQTYVCSHAQREYTSLSQRHDCFGAPVWGVGPRMQIHGHTGRNALDSFADTFFWGNIRSLTRCSASGSHEARAFSPHLISRYMLFAANAERPTLPTAELTI